MISSPLPYSVRWTSKLILRDVRNLKAKYTTKVKNVFVSKSATASAPPHQQTFEEVIVEPEDLQPIIVPSTASVNTASTASPRDDITEVRLSTATAPTEYTQNSDEAGVEAFSTLYELLEAKLKALYAARDHNVSNEERWRFRGSWLLLYMAIQSCPSNNSYDIFRDGKAAPYESKLLLEILQLSTPMASCVPANKISQMPAEPYSKRYSDLLRYDSMFSDTSSNQPGPQSQLAKPTKISTPAHIWHAIMEAATDQSKTASVAEDVLAYVWPEKDATEVLDQIGHPSKQLREKDFAELRHKCQEMLFPEYKLLVGDAKRC